MVPGPPEPAPGAPIGVGSCLNVVGTGTAAQVSTVPCGSRESSYRVFAEAGTSAGCPADRDGVRRAEQNGAEVGALCLYTDWAVGDCYAGGADDVRARVDCAPSAGDEVVRVDDIVLDEGVPERACRTELGAGYPDGCFSVCLTPVT